MLRAAVDDVGGADSFEQLWTERVGADRFELCCIPFFAYDMALGDVVRAEAATVYVIQSVVQRSALTAAGRYPRTRPQGCTHQATRGKASQE